MGIRCGSYPIHLIIVIVLTCTKFNMSFDDKSINECMYIYTIVNLYYNFII